MRTRLAILVVAGLLIGPSAAHAQSPPANPPRRGLEVSVGAALGGPAPLATSAAELRRPNGSAFTLFRTDSRFGPGFGTEVDVTGFPTRRLGLEVSGAWMRQDLRTSISDDAEGALPVSLSQPIDRLSVEGAVLFPVRDGPRTGVFVRAGGGWMQEMSDGATLAETGMTATVGIALKHWWRARASTRGTRIGLRLDGRLLGRSGGVTLGSRAWQVGPAGMAGLVFGFH